MLTENTAADAGNIASPSAINGDAGSADDLPFIYPLKHDDAVIHGKVADDLFYRSLALGISLKGAKTLPGAWKNFDLTIEDLIDLLSTHEEGAKDGKCLLQGDVIEGERKAQAMRSCSILMLDLDTGEDLPATLEKIKALDVFAMVWTTHSHLKPSTSIKKDAVIKFIGEKREPTLEDVRRYLIEVKRYRPYILEQAALGLPQHDKEGLKLVINHAAMPKFRVLFVLEKPFVFADYLDNRTANEEWKAKYVAVSDMLGAFYDRSCVDPSRLMYTPRHGKDATGHEIHVIPGRCLDLDSLTTKTNNLLAFAAKDGARKSGAEYQTPWLSKWMAKHADVFLVNSFFEAHGEYRGPRNGRGAHYKCPNDERHTDAGNPEDMGFYCVDAGDNDMTETFVARCQHDSCQDLKIGHYLDLMIVENRMDEADLEPFCDEGIRPIAEDEAPPEWLEAEVKGEVADADKLAEAVEAFDKKNPRLLAALGANIGASFSAGAITDTERESLISRLATKAGVGKTVARDAVSAGEQRTNPAYLAWNRKQMIEAASAADDEGDDDLEYAEGIVYADPYVLKALAGMNKKWAIVTFGSEVRVMKEPKEIGKSPIFFGTGAFHTLHANKRIDVAWGPDSSGQQTYKTFHLSKLWMGWRERRTYEAGVVFEPVNPPEDSYNLWRGYPMDAKKRPGSWAKMRAHLQETVCGGKDGDFKWTMTWLAQVVQQPGRKLGSCLAIRGKKGVGKSIVFDWVRKGMGIHAIKVSQKKHIVGDFNGHQKGVSLIVCEEAFWAGDHAAGSALKDLITSDQMMFEQKGVDAVPLSNYVRMLFISNEDWMVPVGEEDERRYMVLECGDKHRGNIPYFLAIVDEMENGGLEAMWDDLSKWDPVKDGGFEEGWNILRTPPITDAQLQQRETGLPPWDRFFIGFIEDGKLEARTHPDLPEIVLGEDENEIPVAGLRAHFNAEMEAVGTQEARRKRNDRGLLLRLAQKHLCFEGKAESRYIAGDQHRVYVCPALSVIRERARERNVTLDVPDAPASGDPGGAADAPESGGVKRGNVDRFAAQAARDAKRR